MMISQGTIIQLNCFQMHPTHFFHKHIIHIHVITTIMLISLKKSIECVKKTNNDVYK